MEVEVKLHHSTFSTLVMRCTVPWVAAFLWVFSKKLISSGSIIFVIALFMPLTHWIRTTTYYVSLTHKFQLGTLKKTISKWSSNTQVCSLECVTRKLSTETYIINMCSLTKTNCLNMNNWVLEWYHMIIRRGKSMTKQMLKCVIRFIKKLRLLDRDYFINFKFVTRPLTWGLDSFMTMHVEILCWWMGLRLGPRTSMTRL